MKGYFSLITNPLLGWEIHLESSSPCSDEVFFACFSIIYCVVVLSLMPLWLTGLCWRVITWDFIYRSNLKSAEVTDISKVSVGLGIQPGSLISLDVTGSSAEAVDLNACMKLPPVVGASQNNEFGDSQRVCPKSKCFKRQEEKCACPWRPRYENWHNVISITLCWSEHSQNLTWFNGMVV